MPTIVADKRDANVPANKALIPNSESSFLLLGAREPIPPIWIPIEAKFAKPHNI